MVNPEKSHVNLIFVDKKWKTVFPVYHDFLQEVNPLEKESFLMQ